MGEVAAAETVEAPEPEPDNTMVDLAKRRAPAEARLEELHRKRGAAIVDRQPFDHRKIAKVERELEALHDAGGKLTRRSREAAGRAAQELRQQLVESVGTADQRRTR